jgi:molecular chaperone DnaK
MPLIRSVLEGMFGAKKIIKDGPKAEQAVALGAAIRAAELDGRIKPAVMQQLVTASVGVRVAGGGYYAFIKKGETFPIRRERVLRAAREDQTEIELVVLQGDDPAAKGNTEAWRCTLPVEAGARVPVMLDIDPGGRLKVWIAGEVVYGGTQEDAA